MRPKFHLKVLRKLRELTIFSGDTLEHVDCVIHYLEKQSVVDVLDDYGTTMLLMLPHGDDDDDDSGNEERTESFGDNDEL